MKLFFALNENTSADDKISWKLLCGAVLTNKKYFIISFVHLTKYWIKKIFALLKMIYGHRKLPLKFNVPGSTLQMLTDKLQTN